MSTVSIVSCSICGRPARVRTTLLGTATELTALCGACNRAIATVRLNQDVWTRDRLGGLHSVALPGAA